MLRRAFELAGVEFIDKDGGCALEYGCESGRKKEKLRLGHRGVGRGLPQVGPIIVYFGKTNPKYWRYFKVLTIQKFEIFVALPEFPPGRLNCILTICPRTQSVTRCALFVDSLAWAGLTAARLRSATARHWRLFTIGG